MKKFLIPFCFILLLASCNQRSINEISENKELNVPTPNGFQAKAVKGGNPEFILDNQDAIRQQLVSVAQKVYAWADNASFLESVLKEGEKQKFNTNYYISPSESLTSFPQIPTHFTIQGVKFEVRLLMSFIGQKKKLGNKTSYKKNEIAPKYIAISQLYTPGLIPVLEVGKEMKFKMVRGADIEQENILFVGVAPVSTSKDKEDSFTTITSQGGICGCMLGLSGGCNELKGSPGSGTTVCGLIGGTGYCPDGCP